MFHSVCRFCGGILVHHRGHLTCGQCCYANEYGAVDGPSLELLEAEEGERQSAQLRLREALDQRVQRRQGRTLGAREQQLLSIAPTLTRLARLDAKAKYWQMYKAAQRRRERQRREQLAAAALESILSD